MPEINVAIGALYLILIVILGMEWKLCNRAEVIAWLTLCLNGLFFVIVRLFDSSPDPIFFNIWSQAIRIHTIVTLIIIEAFRYQRMRGKPNGCK
jgi:hypothetical protein